MSHHKYLIISLIVFSKDQSLIVKAINQLAELQQRLVVSDPEMNALVKELGLDSKQQAGNKAENGADVSETNKNNKRKRSTSDDDEEEDDDDDDDEDKDDDEDEKDDQDDEDDEEIFSDTDEEMKADEAKKAKRSKRLANFAFSALGPDQLEEYLAKFNREYQKYRFVEIKL